MKNQAHSLNVYTLSCLTFFMYSFLLITPKEGDSQSFQRFSGTTLDDSFSKVIKDGSNYYVLGQNEPSPGATPRATVTRLDAQGHHEWTLTLDISSEWNDAVLTPNGDLLVVGSTLPFDASTNSLMGLVTAMGGGAFSWINSYAASGRDFCTRIIKSPSPEDPAFPYYVLGAQNVPGATATTDNAFLFNIDEAGNFNWKKIFPDPTDTEFFRDLEVLPNGDLLLAGNSAAGLIFKTDKSGNAIGGVQIHQISFVDIGLKNSGGLCAAANGLTNGDAHILQFDDDLILLSDVIIPQLTSISQVWEGSPGVIYATGRGTFGGFSRDVIISLLANGPSISSVKYLDAGSGYVGGSSWLMPNNEIAYTDARVIPGGLGGDCAFISVSDLDLSTACMVSEDMATLVFADPVPDGPELPMIEFQDFPMGTNLTFSALNWLDGEVCGSDTCGVTLDIIFIDSCGHVQVTAIGTGPQPYSYQWCSGENTPNIDVILPCGPHTFCVTLTCADGTTSTASQTITITDNIPPTAICVPDFAAVDLNGGCTYTVNVADIDAGSFDNCQIQSMSVSPTVLSGCGIFPVTLTVVDWCNNSSTCTTNIQWTESDPPTIICPPDLSLKCDDDLDPSATGFATATDNCDGNPIITYSDVVSGQIPCNGFIQRTWSAEDNCGNITTCLQTISIVDDVKPVLTNCPTNMTVTGTYDGQGVCTADVHIISPTVSDNCDQTPSLTNSFNNTADASGIYPVGTTTVTWTATDACGNEITCMFNVIVTCDTLDCCPEFNLVQLESVIPCIGDNTCSDGSVNFPMENDTADLIACKNSVHTYYVVPNLPGFIYNWSVTGGSLTSTQGSNPGQITWGSGSEGFFQVIIADSTGTCMDTLAQKVCLLDAPVAAFTVAPSTTICENRPVSFSNTSAGANSYYWDFGNGISSILKDPPPATYSAAGTYTVVLTVSNDSNGGEFPCGCLDTATVLITVLPGTGPTITTENCKKMLCPQDTITYCVSPACAPYTWTVNGGTISAMKDSCITVLWDATAPLTVPASVSVTTSCTSVCGNSAVLNVPVLWPDLPIIGEKIVCLGDVTTYSLPVLPGTFYSWSVTGGANIVGPFTNTPSIEVKWFGPGTVICNYTNPYSGCSGTDTCSVDVRKRFMVDGPSPVCVSVSSVYNVNPSSGGNADWTITPGTAGVDFTAIPSLVGVPSISVTWITPGTYSVTAVPSIPSNYCNPSSIIQVQVKPAPILNTIVGPIDVCPNQLYDYTVSSNLSGGSFTWSFAAGSGPGTISPYGPNNSMASVSFTGTASWTLVAAQKVDGCADSTFITINKVPPPILLAPASVIRCIGGQTTAMISVAPGSGPGPYTWSTSSAASLLSGQGTGTATYEIHGTGSITVSNCCGPSNAINVSTILPPVIAITATGGLKTADLILSAPLGPAGTTYNWFGGGTPIPPNSIGVTKPGTYTVQVTYPDGCISSASYTVDPVALPTVSISTGDPLIWCNPLIPDVTLAAFTSLGCTYQWYQNTLSTPVGNGSTYHATSAGTYFVVVTCSGCVVTSNSITVYQKNCNPTGTGCTGSTVNFNPIMTTHCNPTAFSIDLTPCPGATVVWNFGDGSPTEIGTTSSSGMNSVSHIYTIPSVYLVTATIDCNGCTYLLHTKVYVPVTADFLYSVKCGLNGDKTIDFFNTSQTLGGWIVTSVNWTTDCGTPIPPNPGADYSINNSPPCNPTVTMHITLQDPVSLQTCTDSMTHTFQFISTPLSITGPSLICKDATYSFSSSLNGPAIVQYEWSVGGNPVSQDSVLNYAFGGPLAIIGLTVKDTFGCTYTAMDTFPVMTPRPLVIAPVKICPDCSPLATLTATPAGFNNYQWYQNGVVVGNSASYLLCQFNASGNYYVTAEDPLNGKCPVVSNTVPVEYHLKPEANIQGETVICVPANGPYLVPLANSVNNPAYTYLWTAIPAGSITFSPNNAYNTTVTLPALGNYQFILSVIDTITGCSAKDTLCVYLCPNPVPFVTRPSGNLCEGEPHTFTASASPSGNYVFVWSNGVTGPVMTTSKPGYYSVTATSTDCGCSGSSYVGYIQPKPPAALFPIGCDTLCNSDTITPPLILGPGWPANLNGYVIDWYLNSVSGSPFYTGSTLNLANHMPSPLGFGLNNISIVVTYGGCSDTSDVYELFIEPCCVCRRDLVLSQGGVEYPVFCDPHVGFIPSLPCPADNVFISGFIGYVDSISGELCEESSVLWELIKPDSSTIGGITTNFTAFIFPKDSVSAPGTYCLNLTVLSPDGNNTCVCKVTWYQEPCPPCCTSYEDFCDRLENTVSVSVDNQLCKATLNVGDLGCDSYIDWVDWDYPNQQQSGPYPPGSMPMNTYPGSGTYTVCYLAIELDSLNQICWEKVVCDTITLACKDCPCDKADLYELGIAVGQGFATISSSLGCQRCFAPLALSECEKVEWHINTITPTPVFTSTGNQTFCYNFVSSGTYEVIMVVKRYKPDGSICESFTYSRFITVNCNNDPTTCTQIPFPNPGFDKGAIPGGLNPGGMGMTEGWTAALGTPIVVEGASGSLDGWTIDVSTDQESVDILTTIEPICPENKIDTLSLRYGIKEKGIKSTITIAFYRGDEFEVPDSTNWNPIRCLRLASIDLDPLEENVWYDLEIPYDISEWIELDSCSIRPAIFTYCCLPVTSRTSVALDGFCVKSTVATNDIATKQTINLFPNPTTGELTIRFDDGSPRNGQMQILDLLGRVVRSESLKEGSRDQTISLEMVPTGVYFIKITEKGMPVWIEKVIKH